MATKKQKQEAREMVAKFQDNRHFQRIMEAFLNFEPDGEEADEDEEEFVAALEWVLYTLKKQFVTLAAYSTVAMDEKHEKNVSRLARELMAVPTVMKQKPEEEKKSEPPSLRVINGGKN